MRYRNLVNAVVMHCHFFMLAVKTHLVEVIPAGQNPALHNFEK